jgi:hypothetical protein
MLLPSPQRGKVATTDADFSAFPITRRRYQLLAGVEFRGRTLPDIGRATRKQPVGWVERNDTHQLPFAKMMGFAKGSTHPTGCHRNFDGQRHARFYKWRDDGMVPLICPTCQNVFAGKASMPAPPCYFAWGCFQYFSPQPVGWVEHLRYPSIAVC